MEHTPKRGASRKKFFYGTAALAVCSVLAKLLGALFRIPLTNIIGAEGIGLYQMVFPLYTVLLTVSSGGLSIAISKLTAAQIAGGNPKGALKVLRVSLASLAVFALAATLFLVLLRQKIAAVQGNPMAALAYLGIAPSIIFVALTACFKGYFQGRGNMLPSGISQIIEQLIKLIAGLFFAAFFMRYGVEFAVFGTLIGVSLSELAALFYLAFQFYLGYLKRRRGIIIPLKRLYSTEAADLVAAAYVPQSKTRQVLGALYRIAIPVTLGSLIMPLTQVIDSVMVINILTLRGLSRTAATSLFGLVSGPISSLINMPVVITLSVSVALLPKIAAWREKALTGEKRDEKKAADLVEGALRFVFLVSLPCMAVFLFFSRRTVGALYSRGLTVEQLKICATLLKIESLSILFVGLVQVSTSVLQGADLAHRPAVNLLYGAVAKVILTLILLPVLGIAGAAIASVVCYGITALAGIICMRRVTRPKINVFKLVIMPLAASGLLAITAYFCQKALSGVLGELYSFLLALILGATVYAAFLLLTKTVRLKDLLG